MPRIKTNNNTSSSLGILFLAELFLQMLASFALSLDICEVKIRVLSVFPEHVPCFAYAHGFLNPPEYTSVFEFLKSLMHFSQLFFLRT